MRLVWGCGGLCGGQVLSCDDIKFRGPYSLFIEWIIMQNEGRCDDIMDGRSD